MGKNLETINSLEEFTEAISENADMLIKSVWNRVTDPNDRDDIIMEVITRLLENFVPNRYNKRQVRSMIQLYAQIVVKAHFRHEQAETLEKSSWYAFYKKRLSDFPAESYDLSATEKHWLSKFLASEYSQISVQAFQRAEVSTKILFEELRTEILNTSLAGNEQLDHHTKAIEAIQSELTELKSNFILFVIDAAFPPGVYNAYLSKLGAWQIPFIKLAAENNFVEIAGDDVLLTLKGYLTVKNMKVAR